MPCTVTGISIRVDNAQQSVVWTAQKYVYLQPSRTDFEFTTDGGTTWQSWVGDPDLASSYPGAIKAPVNLTTGAWTFSVPHTDADVKFSLDGASPALQWSIIDPNTQSGVRVSYGPLLAAVASSGKTLKQLLQLASPDTWRTASTSYTGSPNGPRRAASVTFSAGQQLLNATWPSMNTTAWRATLGIRTDDTGGYVANIVKGSETATGCQIALSQAPPSGKVVQVDMEVF